jgi:Ca-activated chloride channel family protein
VTPSQNSMRSNLSRAFYLSALLLFVGTILAHSEPLPLPQSSSGASGQSAISVNTDLVVLPVSVMDGGGNFITGLTLQDFRVYEDKRLQTVTSFQQQDTPVTVGLIVDHSRSMGPKLSKVSVAVSAFARSSNPKDEMFVVDFNDNISVEMAAGKPFTDDATVLERAVAAVSARGRTALYDAVAVGLSHLQLSHLDKKALIIVSDGGDNASQHTYAEVLELARQSKAVIYAIGLADPYEEEDPKVLRRLCKDTGGIAYFPDSGQTVTDISTQIARDLREQYTLGFSPDKTNIARSYKRIEVKVAAPGRGKVKVRTRNGYFGADEKSSSTPYGKDSS